MIKILRKALPALAFYMTKNAGIKTVTDATATGIIPALMVILESPSVQDGLTALGATGQVGAIVAASIIGLRTALGFWRMTRTDTK